MGLKSFLAENPTVKVFIFAGKGGTGKTTLSAALSYYLASNGYRVLCFSTDPQASLSDIFEINAYGKGIIEVTKNLYVLEIDADKEIRDYVESIKRKIKDMYKMETLPKEIEDYIESAAAEPAMYESATYDRMVDIVNEGKFDYYIFDMPPFGHGIRMIAMADILNKWVEKTWETMAEARKYEEIIARLRGEEVKENEMLKELDYIRSRITSFRNIVMNRKLTAFFMVINPDRLSIDDTEKALSMFSSLNMELSGIVINQVYPPDLLTQQGLPDHLRYRIEEQIKYLREIRDRFGKWIKAVVPMFPREPKGLKALSEVSKELIESRLMEVVSKL